MQSMSSVSLSVSDTTIARGDKMRVVVSITAPPGWRLISQNGKELIYERIAARDGTDTDNFEIRAFTTIENRKESETETGTFILKNDLICRDLLSPA
jgi:hypothetical protein